MRPGFVAVGKAAGAIGENSKIDQLRVIWEGNLRGMSAHSPIGVIFDMDGVLVDSSSAHLQSWQLLAREIGGSVTGEQFARTFGRQNRDIIPILFGEGSEERLRSLADRKEELYRDLIRDDPPIVEGSASLVAALHDAGVRLAVGSSGPLANIQLVLNAIGIADRMSVVVSGDDVVRGKPDPQVFTIAADRLGLGPNKCVVIEDAPVGIRAAQAAGAKTVAILLYHSADAFEGVDCIVPRLADLSVETILSIVE